LLKQLAPGGRLVLPIGPRHGNQMLIQVDKKANGTIEKKDLMG
jgi:protein-L-isoaspartate(D-aspartate) O-methyltransferase